MGDLYSSSWWWCFGNPQLLISIDDQGDHFPWKFLMWGIVDYCDKIVENKLHNFAQTICTKVLNDVSWNCWF